MRGGGGAVYEWEGRGWVQGYWGGEGEGNERGNFTRRLGEVGHPPGACRIEPEPGLTRRRLRAEEDEPERWVECDRHRLAPRGNRQLTPSLERVLQKKVNSFV